ncbi:MAG: thiol peroxidase [Proteobacteria bacterium]|nr:thiol peroxidase [Pseudomonadota bacterium]
MKTNANITFQGNKLAILGAPIKEGDHVPNVKLTGNDMADVELSSFRGKTMILAAVPSLDTPVCSIETKRLNTEVAKMGGNVVLVTVSMDLPFAQKRWCGSEGASNVVTLSDYKYRAFGEAFGCHIQSWGLLARVLFVVDKLGKVQHVDYVPEIASEPDYDAALAKVQEIQ